MERHSVRDVADILGIITGAVRSRLSRGTPQSVKEHGTVFVLLLADTHRDAMRDAAEMPGESASLALISELREHNATLREQLQAEREANRESRRNIAMLTSRVPELEAPRAPPGASERTTGETEGSEWLLVEALRRAHRDLGGRGGSVAETVWSCKEEYGSACKGLPANKEHKGKYYCVLHFPSEDKDQATFTKAVEKKLKEDNNLDFRGVYFPGNQNFASLLPNATVGGR